MTIDILTLNGASIAEIHSDERIIHRVDDALDLIGNCGYQGADSILLQEHQLAPEFFDLKTGIAGEILQKFSTYGLRLAIVGNFDKYPGKSLKDFIYESNKGRRVNFVGTVEEARNILSA
jgi:hypothetical protein